MGRKWGGRPSERQKALGRAIQALAWGRSSITHGEAIDQLAATIPREQLLSMLSGVLMHKALPPGCRMTATHFVFD